MKTYIQQAGEEGVPFIQTSKMFCILSRIPLLCRSPTTLSNNINNIWEVNSPNLLLSWICSRANCFCFVSVLPQAMVSTLVKVPWDLLSFVRMCVSWRIYFLYTFFVHAGKHGCGWIYSTYIMLGWWYLLNIHVEWYSLYTWDSHTYTVYACRKQILEIKLNLH